jgi:hypothetical protein
VAKALNQAVTVLSDSDVLEVEIGTVKFEAVQFVASWAINEIPTAMIMLAVGRDARSPGARTPATANLVLQDLNWMDEATVTLTPRGDYKPGVPWPAGGKVIFNGRFTGTGEVKSNGKVYVTVHLVHWLSDLAGSSTLSAVSHPANPANLTAPAVMQPFGQTSAGALPVSVSEHIGMTVISSQVEQDLWGGVKAFLTALASTPRMLPLTTGAGGCGIDWAKNTAALSALSRIEGPFPGPWRNHVPLALETRGVHQVADSVALSIGRESLGAYAGMTFWDALVGSICPQFNMMLVPLVGSAVIAADTPALRTPFKDIDPGEYEGLDISGMIAQPLRGVAVYANFDPTKTGVTEPGLGVPTDVGGCYLPPGVPTDGVTRYILPPPWLDGVTMASVLGPYVCGVLGEQAAKAATAPGAVGAVPPDSTPGVLAEPVRQLYSDYARAFHVANALRGRGGSLTGKLRFDIAPGSVVRLLPKPELFLGGVDGLSVNRYACVNRVTVALNSEARVAATTFVLTHMRTEQENQDDRTSTDSHPLFGKNVFKGASLVAEWNL